MINTDSKSKEKALVICPGRGTYTKETLGYFRQFQDERSRAFIGRLDGLREREGYPTLSSLDQAQTYSVAAHTPGEHASALIYACSLLDFMNIDRDRYDVEVVVGNSMGWYLALACAGALPVESGHGIGSAYQVVQTMGSMMKEKIIGGQLIYPVVDSEWRRDKNKERLVLELVRAVNETPGHQAFVSIYLGGYLVLAGNEKGLSRLMKELPPAENYPFKLVNHAAFHTPLLHSISKRAFEVLPSSLFSRPTLPLVDGRGKIWMPYSSELDDLYDYTLNHQVVAPYDFTASVETALKEFAPTKIILLGPGNTLGGAIGQVLINMKWQGIGSKKEFQERQKADPFLLSMGVAEQRRQVTDGIPLPQASRPDAIS